MAFYGARKVNNPSTDTERRKRNDDEKKRDMERLEAKDKRNQWCDKRTHGPKCVLRYGCELLLIAIAICTMHIVQIKIV